MVLFFKITCASFEFFYGRYHFSRSQVPFFMMTVVLFNGDMLSQHVDHTSQKRE
jgi:hypothetical protein